MNYASCIEEIKSFYLLDNFGCCGGIVVSNLAFHSDDPS